MALFSRLISKTDKTKAHAWKKDSFELFTRAKNRNTSQKTTDNFYGESLWLDDMALASLTLFELTQDTTYLNQARTYIKELPEIWYYSYDHLQPLVYYKWGNLDPDNKNQALQHLEIALTRYQVWKKIIYSHELWMIFTGEVKLIYLAQA